MSSARSNQEAIAAFTPTIHRDTYPFISPTSPSTNLSGRSVFIAGASKGIGRATALSYAAAGCSTIIVGARSDLSDLEDEIRKAAASAGRKGVPKVVSVRLDVKSEDSVKAAAEVVQGVLGAGMDGGPLPLDVLICNAGHMEEWKAVGASEPSEWWNSWEVNLRGTYLCCRYFVPLLLLHDDNGDSDNDNNGLKTAVLTSSYGALVVAPTASAYQGAKFAVCRLTECLAAEYESRGLVAFAVHPGGVRTDLSLNMPAYMHKVLVDEPALPADTLVWLARERRPWLSGRFVSVEWDMRELEERKGEVVERDLLKFRMAC
ncbi:putative nad-p-binding protein [Eutypa lata UCREL1]|uniref:Putative nad-p-binding protein n=1 Tax=Eutypa lata (strain UCR-EL1) TaxID=1287681 RepID=M7SXP3_EUTLA|nr:putative nad-p-binding protein [Eutypa lata UCREL1]